MTDRRKFILASGSKGRHNDKENIMGSQNGKLAGHILTYRKQRQQQEVVYKLSKPAPLVDVLYPGTLHLLKLPQSPPIAHQPCTKYSNRFLFKYSSGRSHMV